MAKPSKPRFFKPAANASHSLPWRELQLTINRISREGRGIANHNGKVVFVDGALPEEIVTARCTSTQRSFDEARTIAVTNPSPERVAPFCPVAEQCGGCQLQHWQLDKQRQHKADQLMTDLKKINPALIVEDSLTGDSQRFRHRLKLAVQTDNDFSLAMRKESSHDLVTIEHCPITSDGINHWIKKLPALLADLSGLFNLNDIDLDEDTQGAVGIVCRFSKPPTDAVLQRLLETLTTAGAAAITVFVAAGRGQWKLLEQLGALQLTLSTQSGSLKLSYCPGDFTQTNWVLNQLMINTALEWLAPQLNEAALDLFSGIGNFSLPLAQQVKTMHGIESVKAMVDAAAANASTNHLDNATFSVMDLLQEGFVLPKADIALIDPPRTGAELVCKQLAKQKTLQRLLYVSCNPATLVRDAAILATSGLRPVKAAFVDMFAYTGHGEAITLFVKGEG